MIAGVLLLLAGAAVAFYSIGPAAWGLGCLLGVALAVAGYQRLREGHIR